MEAYLDWQKKSGGIKLNDVIDEYRYVAAGKQIKAGDLVNYINGIAGKTDYGESVDTQLSTNSNTGYTISAVKLDESRVFIAHSYGSSYYLYGAVCTINGAAITCGPDIQLSAATYSGMAISAKILPNGKVFVAHDYETNHRLWGMLVSIEGAEIKVVTDTQLSGTSNTGYAISTELLPNGSIFIAHSYNTSYHLYGMICTISDTKISYSDTAIATTSKSGYFISTCLLPNGNVFIAHSYGSSNYLYGIVCSISGTTITSGSDTALVSSQYAGSYISTCLLPNGNVFIAHSYSSGYYLQGRLISISGTTISELDNLILRNSAYTAYAMSTHLLPNGDVFIAHSGDFAPNETTYYLYGIIVSVSNNRIVAGTDIELINTRNAGSRISSLLLDNGTIFIAHSNSTSYYLNAQIWGIDYENNIPTNNIIATQTEQQVTPAIEPPFNAVALSSGVGGTDTEHNQQVKIARVASKLSMLPVGALVKDVNSTFLGEPVIWKIADKNHEGYPDGSVTLVTERSIALRAFDAKEPNNSDADRQSYGNNRYSVSNIRQWLNSDAEAGQWYSAQHSADQSPTTDYVSVNAYSDDSGFLNGFSDNFKNALLETTLTVVLNTVTDGGGSENVTDKIFLASTTEVGLANENSIAEGSLLSIFSDDASRIAYVTSKAIEDSKYASDPANDTTAFGWLLRTPVASLTVNAHFANETGALRGVAAYYGFRGVRPLCNIPSSTMVSDKPDEDGCYTLFAGGEA